MIAASNAVEQWRNLMFNRTAIAPLIYLKCGCAGGRTRCCQKASAVICDIFLTTANVPSVEGVDLKYYEPGAENDSYWRQWSIR